MSEGDTNPKAGRSISLSAPVATVLVGGFSLVSAVIGGLISGGYKGTIEVERYTLQKDLVLKAIDKEDPQEVRNTLEFLAKAGLVQDYEKRILAYLEATPNDKLPTGAQFGRLDANEYTQKVARYRPLLDFLGKPESGGNYNAYFGNAKNTDSPRLTSMTINKVMEWQKSYTDGGKPSSAAGKYQLIRRDIQKSIVEIGLSGDELFDAMGQDMIAVWKFEQIGLDRFLSGKITTEEFGLALAKEWASLPVPSDVVNGSRQIKAGQSYYGGDGLTMALVSVADFVSVLNGLKAGS